MDIEKWIKEQRPRGNGYGLLACYALIVGVMVLTAMSIT